MEKVVATGVQDYAKLIEDGSFFVDKTNFIREWWSSRDEVTLITRPRRFGKTLNLSMLNYFFSNKYQGRSDLFEGMNVWKDEAFHALQGSYPVIFLTFADVKAESWEDAREFMNDLISTLYDGYEDMMQDPMFSEADRKKFYRVGSDMRNPTAAVSLRNLCGWLHRYYGKKVLIFLDEYDTPMQEAWINGYWKKMTAYVRSLFNSTFKTNPHLERALMTGITRVSKESIFSDLNNLKVITATSWKYETAFGFTEQEVFDAMEAQGCTEQEKTDVKEWYDGFNFGRVTDIYNPWSVTNYLSERRLKAWWANSSSNQLIGKLLQQGNAGMKTQMENLLKGENLLLPIDEEIVYNQLDDNPEAVWSLMLTAGYLKVVRDPTRAKGLGEGSVLYNLTITNRETRDTIEDLVKGWFKKKRDYVVPDLINQLLRGRAEDAEDYLNRLLRNTISYFDPGTPEDAPESFYHGLVLGMIVERMEDYHIWSNRESGYGRYDVVMEPKDRKQPAVILEFKTFHPDREKTLEEAAGNALKQIEDRQYDTELLTRGIPAENIHKYGIAFKGKICSVRMSCD